MIKFVCWLLFFSFSASAIYPLIYQILPDRFFNGIVFYRGLLAALIVFLITFLPAFFLLYSKRNCSFSEMVTSVALFTSSFISLSFNITFLIVLPVSIDRSLTTYLLEKIKNEQYVTTQRLEYLLIEDYIIKRQAVSRRIEEQITTGNLKMDKNNILLTDQGRNFIELSEYIRRLFKLKDRSADYPDGKSE